MIPKVRFISTLPNKEFERGKRKLHGHILRERFSHSTIGMMQHSVAFQSLQLFVANQEPVTYTLYKTMHLTHVSNFKKLNTFLVIHIFVHATLADFM